MKDSAKDFLPIPINEFISGVNLSADVHIRIGEDNFVLVGKAGTRANVEQLKNYKNYEVNYLWVHKKDYQKLAVQSITLAGIALSKKDLSQGLKTSVVSSAARSMFRQVEHLGMDREAYSNAKQITEVVVVLAETHDTMAALMKSLASFSEPLVAHSVAVSMISVMIGQHMGFEKKATLEKLAMGALLHDIGLKSVPLELVNKPLASMTAQEVALYETHAYKGMQMLLSLGIVPDDVVSIVYEHHENSIGQGFPQRLRDVKMHPLAKIVSLANAYCNLVLPNVNCPTPKNPREALMYLEHTLGIPFNREAFRALKRLVEKESKAAA